MTDSIELDPHPLLEAVCFHASWPEPLGQVASPSDLVAALTAEAENIRDDETKGAVRRMLRTHGYRPAGRGKPASEFLVAACEKGILSSINPAVDGCNAASLWGGLPISVVDAELAHPPLRIGLPAEGAAYVFNRTGQEITLTGLLCLHDSEGPCANAVKDSQRTKTHEGTRSVVVVVWGTQELPGRATAVAERFRGWIEGWGGSVRPIVVEENRTGD